MKLASAESNDISDYETYYRLAHRPFSLSPDVRFLYKSRAHSTAFEQVTDALRRREGLIVVTGEIGTGKTVLCRTLLETFEPRTFLSVILDPRLTVSDLLQQVLIDFGLMTPGNPAVRSGAVNRHQLVSTLQRFLSALIPVGGHAVIMIDEAQHLDPTVLEEIRLLSNFDAGSINPLHIVLVGQPDLDLVLRRPDLEQLCQRVGRRFELRALAANEVHEYIERRMEVAACAETRAPGDDSGDTVRFTPGALRAIARISGGIPRVINTICDQALEIGFERRSHSIDRAVVSAAAGRLKLRGAALVPVPAPLGVGLAAGLFLACAATGAWWWASPSGSTASAPSVAVAVADGSNGHRPAPTAGVHVESPPAPISEVAPAVHAADAPSRRPSDASTVPADAAYAKNASGFEIAVAAFRTAQRAEEVADAIAQKGLPASTLSDPNGAWHRIVVGPLNSLDAAESVQQALARQGFSGTTISASRPERR